MKEDPMKTAYYKAKEACADVLVNALLQRYKELTGEDGDQELYDAIYNVVRFK